MSIKELFASVDEEVIETYSEDLSGQEEETDIAGLFPSAQGKELEKIYGQETDKLNNLSSEEITEDITGEKPESLNEFEEEHSFGADVILYPPKGDELSWEQTFKTEAGNCTVSLSSKLAMESMQLDEHAKEQMLQKAKDALKVYSLPNEQAGFTSKVSMIEANLTTPERVVVVDSRSTEEPENEDREAFLEKVVDEGGVVVETPEDAARYVSSYLV
jgi:hypothetical protein